MVYEANDHVIALLRGLAIVPKGSEDNERLAASLQAELMRLGFAFDEKAYRAACKAPKNWLIAYYKAVIPAARVKLGDARNFVPFYRNFPTQVMETPDFMLFLNAIVHYWTGGEWEPTQELRARGMAFENVEFKPIRLGTNDDFSGIFSRLVQSNQALTPQDKEVVEWFVDKHRDHISVPNDVPFKETLCILASKGLDVHMSSPTDVLRVAVYMSGGDISLSNMPKSSRSRWIGTPATATKFKKFSRLERRRLLSMLEETGCSAEEMQRHLGRWLRLGEILHVGEYYDRYPKVAASFKALRNQPPKIRSFNGKVDMAFAKGWEDGVRLLAERPGEFSRRLDWMLREFDTEAVLSVFSTIGHEVSGKVLFELYKHFERRLDEGSVRSVILKGARSKMKTLDPLPPMDEKVVRRVKDTIMRIVSGKIARLPKMGKVWIDERLKDVPAPFSMRSLNSSVKTYVRGTRIPFRKDAKVIRAFLHWFDEDCSVDLDLSADFRTESLGQVTHIAFTNLKDMKVNCCHSGDIRHRQGACAEYVDVDIAACKAKDVRYVVMQAHNFDGRPFHVVKDAVFGLMEREYPESGKIFVPATISNCAKLANEGSSVIVCILDLKEGCYIWADLEADMYLPVLQTNAGRSSDVIQTLVSKPALSIYDMLSMHANARGSLVERKGSADVKFEWEELVSDYSKVLEYMNI